ncbi:unnamed protein product [Oikopleura dioica]|uniref:RRM domain-containing protein n=1 Tax=Oikopleura dioica TaxID=34765 RepID=E4XS52_OIKDI|nr:unnamed protein product [Oikopleura dioica]
MQAARDFRCTKDYEVEQRDQGRPQFDRPRFNDSCQIFVGALPRNMTEEDINGVFEEFGEVQHIRINQGNRADSKNGFGFYNGQRDQNRGAPRGPREFNGEGGGYRNRDNRGAPRNNKQF